MLAASPGSARWTSGALAGPLLTMVGVVAVPIGLAATVDRTTYDTWGAFVWGPALLVGCLPLARWAARRTGEPELVRFLMGAAVLKIIVGTLTRAGAAALFYGGLADAARYDNRGGLLVPDLRAGRFGELGEITGTRSIEVLTGVVKAVIGDTRAGAMGIFSAFAFVGMVLAYVAFCDGVPDGNRRLFRSLLFLSPTMWYWPSSIGKEAVMLLALGALLYGATRVLGGHVGGLLLGGASLWTLLVVRPHIALVFAAGLLLSVLPIGRGTGPRPALARLAPVLVLLLLPVVVGRAQEFLGLEDLSRTEAREAAAGVTEQTGQGGSEFAAADPFTPSGFAVGIVTVLLRPFPTEASGVQGLVSSAEVTVLGAICGLVLWRSRRGFRAAIGNATFRLCVGYVLVFGAAFATVGNFGIIARQRSLVLPFVFAVVAAMSGMAARRQAPERQRAPAAGPGRVRAWT